VKYHLQTEISKIIILIEKPEHSKTAASNAFNQKEVTAITFYYDYCHTPA